MAELDILDFLDLGRAKPILSDSKNLSESEAVILNEVKEKEFGVDSVYFNTDEETNNSFPAVFLKKITNFSDIETLKDIAEAQRKIWNYKKVLFLYVYSEIEIRIYNCSEKPLIITQQNFDYEKELKGIELKSYKYSDKQQLQELNKLFSRIAIDTGIIWSLKEAKAVRDKINLQKRVDKYLVTSLINTAEYLRNQGLDIDYIHKIILRSLFLLYLEDRGAAGKDFYNQIKKGAESYFDILDDVKATHDLFEQLEDHFNGNVFTLEKDENISKEQLQIIKTCFIRGNEKIGNLQLFDDWKQFRLFNFKIIQIELLSEVYENFLAETDPTLKENSGTYYTPPSLVEFILNEKLPINDGEKEYNVKTLDPSCGSGIFLVESFKRLVKRYENAHNLDSLSDFDTLVQILKDNIFGIEIHPQAIKVAAFSLYLALVDKLDPKNLWQNRNYRLPYLVNDPNEKNEEKKGRNLFCRDTISDLSSIDELRDFKLIVGNPPFGKLLAPEKDEKGKQKNIREYCNEYGFAKEMVLPFLHKATTFSPKGEIALIFNTKVLTNTNGTFQNFREWLFQECYVERVYNFSILRKAPESFGGQLFGDATGPISILFYQKEKPESLSDTIAYYAPKTYIKSNIIEGLNIDFTDLKYLPREECQKPDSKIWKIAMWGGINDWELITNILKSSISLKDYFKSQDNNWEKPRVGLNGDLKKPDFIPEYVIDAGLIQRHYTPQTASKANTKTFRNIDKKVFNPPFVIMKKGQHKKQLAASYIDYFSYCTTACYIFNGDVDPAIKKALTSVLNSKLTTYLLFLTSASWGIEREQIFMDEVLESPAIIPLLKADTLNKIVNLFEEILSIKKSDNLFDDRNIEDFENEINSIIIDDIFEFSANGKNIVKDSLEYNLDLFENQMKSNALYPVLKDQPKKYAKIITSELNEFLDGQEIFANATVYNLKNDKSSPLMMIKLSHDKAKKDISTSNENIDEELKKLDQYLWEQKAKNIYFRKKLNYKAGNDIYIIRPNQRRFWSQSMALEDASELVLEILNGIHDEA
ncbi:N-6 DNA methylase [Elizabethkingia miricola]|uniref:N-6 DNA methylase n=1 Tax=Elizabethkingia miricola TaxID=172045 RepID=UPI002ACE6C31|nr:N-6 DNA methylase [Elizabethkingia miricola]WQM38788.1 N-6 DNA methylase [Elizabethkingia miricola]